MVISGGPVVFSDGLVVISGLLVGSHLVSKDFHSFTCNILLGPSGRPGGVRGRWPDGSSGLAGSGGSHVHYGGRAESA